MTTMAMAMAMAMHPHCASIRWTGSKWLVTLESGRWIPDSSNRPNNPSPDEHCYRESRSYQVRSFERVLELLREWERGGRYAVGE